MDWTFVIDFNNFNKLLSFKQLVSIPSDILNKNLLQIGNSLKVRFFV